MPCVPHFCLQVSRDQLHGQNSKQAYAWGRVGVAPTPGSTTVYDRASQKMVECNQTLCPFATRLTPSPLDNGSRLTPSTAAAPNNGSLAVWVNRAPASLNTNNRLLTFSNSKALSGRFGAALLGYTNSHNFGLYMSFDSPAFYSAASLMGESGMSSDTYASLNMSYYNSTQFLLDMYTYFGSLKGSPWDVYLTPELMPSGPQFLDAALAQGYEKPELVSFMRAALWSLVHPNLVSDAQMIPFFRLLVAEAGRNMMQVSDGCRWITAVLRVQVAGGLQPPPQFYLGFSVAALLRFRVQVGHDLA